MLQNNQHKNFKVVCKRKSCNDHRYGNFPADLGRSLSDKYRNVKKSARESSTMIYGKAGNAGKTSIMEHILGVYDNQDLTIFIVMPDTNVCREFSVYTSLAKIH